MFAGGGMDNNQPSRSKSKVAVFPAGSEIALEINRALQWNSHFEILGITSVNDSSLGAYGQLVSGAPLYTDDEFLDFIEQLVRLEKIDYIFPCMDEVGYKLKQAEDWIGCEVVYAELATAEIIRRKSVTICELTGYVPVPEVYHSLEQIQFPCIVKPDIGYGSRGVKLLEQESDLQVLSPEYI